LVKLSSGDKQLKFGKMVRCQLLMILLFWVIQVSVDAQADTCSDGECMTEENSLLVMKTATRSQQAKSSQITVKEGKVLAATNQYKDGVVLELSKDSVTTTLEAIKIKGGLIQYFKLNGKNMLFFGTALDQMDGSIFWPAPQSAWGWPPPKEIDPTPSKDFNIEYTLEIDQASKSFTLTSPIASSVNLQMSKRVSMDPESGAVVLDFKMKNTGWGAKSWAPWEVTRVRPNGLTFYATGSLQPTSGTWKPLPVKQIGGVTWFQQSISLPKGKLYADTSEGWLAHTDGELVMVNCFEKIPANAAAPGEQQIEIYDGQYYVEVEVQGAYQSIQPQGTLDWNHRWFLRPMPAGSVMEPGNMQLVSLARSLCGSPSPTPSPSPSPSPTPSPIPSPIPGGNGCCKWGPACGDCGNDGNGWCHQSAGNCRICTGSWDSGGRAPSCR